jgi:hypothetical protein
MGPEKTPGNENVHPFVTQKCTKTLALSLSLIFQQSFDHGEISEFWLKPYKLSSNLVTSVICVTTKNY